jgi:hypothetical protein
MQIKKLALMGSGGDAAGRREGSKSGFSSFPD